MMDSKGKILQLQHYSVNDGDGIRTVIFLPDARFAVNGVRIRKGTV